MITRIRTIMIPAITIPAITKGRCITIKTAIPTNRRATTIPVFTKLKRTTIRMPTTMNRNQTIRRLSQRRSDWVGKATIAARQTVCSALRCRKPSGVIKAPMACARLDRSCAFFRFSCSTVHRKLRRGRCNGTFIRNSCLILQSTGIRSRCSLSVQKARNDPFAP